MRNHVAVGSILLVLAFSQSNSGFSPIWNVDGWNSERLGKVGITVSPWKHDLQSEYPPFEWVRVTFDCSQLPKEQDVLITAWVMSKGKTVSVFRAERDKRAPDAVALLFALQEEYLDTSHVDVFIWKPKLGDGHEASGYTLSVKRIIELSREKTANKQVDATR